MKRIRSNYSTLKLLKKAEPKLRKAIISKCGPDLLKCISEVALNVLRGNVKLTTSTKRKLKKFKGQIRKVASKDVSDETKKKLIVQKGGFIGPLLAAVLPVVASLLFNKLS